MSEWQPIETAPKDKPFIGLVDGLPILVRSEKYYVKLPHEKGGPTYQEIWTAETFDALIPCHPTHWMRLPPLP